MSSIQAWSQFFGWCTVLNVGTYVISVAMVLTMRPVLVRWSSRWFGLPDEVVLRAVFNWLVAYKLGIMLFSIVPWLALTLMA